MRRFFASVSVIGLLAAAASAAAIAAGPGVTATKHLGFGHLQFYTSVSKTRTVNNKTDGTITYYGQSGLTGAFQMANNCSSIPSHSSCDITITFNSGNTPGTYTNTLDLHWTASGQTATST